jgi:hypothetical protein
VKKYEILVVDVYDFIRRRDQIQMVKTNDIRRFRRLMGAQVDANMRAGIPEIRVIGG